MDSKQDFLNTIKKEYFELTKGQVADELLNIVAEKVADYYYEQYLRFRKQYPKSIKRYSTFQINDLDHPDTFENVINTLKEKAGVDYEKYAILILNMTLAELKEFEKNREEFYKMF